MSIETIYRVRLDFWIPEKEDKRFWQGIFNAPQSQKAQHLESCEKDMFVKAEFDSQQAAHEFNHFMGRYLEVNGINQLY